MSNINLICKLSATLLLNPRYCYAYCRYINVPKLCSNKVIRLFKLYVRHPIELYGKLQILNIFNMLSSNLQCIYWYARLKHRTSYNNPTDIKNGYISLTIYVQPFHGLWLIYISKLCSHLFLVNNLLMILLEP